MLRKIIAFCIAATPVAQAIADQVQNDSLSMEIREIPGVVTAGEEFAGKTCKDPAAPMSMEDDPGVILDTIINTGKEIWKIIEANKPVVNVNTDVASALPMGIESWSGLECWQAPKSKGYQVIYKNGFGTEVVKFTFYVLYTYGGQYKSKGRYLSYVTVMGDVDVVWGYTFNAEAHVPNVINTSTPTDPVAGMELIVKWSVDTVFKHSRSSAAFYVDGNGSYKKLY